MLKTQIYFLVGILIIVLLIGAIVENSMILEGFATKKKNKGAATSTASASTAPVAPVAPSTNSTTNSTTISTVTSLNDTSLNDTSLNDTSSNNTKSDTSSIDTLTPIEPNIDFKNIQQYIQNSISTINNTTNTVKQYAINASDSATSASASATTAKASANEASASAISAKASANEASASAISAKASANEAQQANNKIQKQVDKVDKVIGSVKNKNNTNFLKALQGFSTMETEYNTAYSGQLMLEGFDNQYPNYADVSNIVTKENTVITKYNDFMTTYYAYVECNAKRTCSDASKNTLIDLSNAATILNTALSDASLNAPNYGLTTDTKPNFGMQMTEIQQTADDIQKIRSDLDMKMAELLDKKSAVKTEAETQFTTTQYITVGWSILAAGALYYVFTELE